VTGLVLPWLVLLLALAQPWRATQAQAAPALTPESPPMTTPPANPVEAALEGFRNVTDYRVTIRSSHDGSSEVLRYFYKKPGFVRMEFIRPHNGAVLLYDPASKMVRLKPLGFFKSLTLTFSPDNSLVKSAQGHSVDESDIGNLLEGAKSLQEHGRTTVLGEEKVGERMTLAVAVEGGKNFALGRTHRFRLNLDEASWLPLKVKAYDEAGNVIEVVHMDDLETNVHLDDSLFRP
jgi:outer membrane lipoprotein-sorting protein